eukprot:gene11541-biopygen2670
MLSRVIKRPRAGSLTHLRLTAFSDGEQCSAALAQQGYDVVFSLDVAEHMPRGLVLKLHTPLADLLGNATRGYIIFSAGEPIQKGIENI